ncbi:MAG: MarR family winged helix-turn-helix transcriptional regulator [Oscillospiraceae bacterium]
MFPMIEKVTGEKPVRCDSLSESEYEEFLHNMQSLCEFDVSRIICGITPAELALMYSCAVKEKDSKEPLTVANAAASLKVSVPAISRSLNNLEKKGYIKRTVNKNDRRSVYISLSDSGKTTLIENLHRFEQTMMRILSHFTEEELRTMIRLQSKFVKAAFDVTSEADSKT